MNLLLEKRTYIADTSRMIVDLW